MILKIHTCDPFPLFQTLSWLPFDFTIRTKSWPTLAPLFQFGKLPFSLHYAPLAFQFRPLASVLPATWPLSYAAAHLEHSPLLSALAMPACPSVVALDLPDQVKPPLTLTEQHNSHFFAALTTTFLFKKILTEHLPCARYHTSYILYLI